jgi:DNA-directed RNA polymerase specialized sigma subunit
MPPFKKYRKPRKSDIALFERHLPYVQWCCQHYGFWRATKCGMTHSDFFQQGAMGLWKAVLTYDKKKGVQFVTYARPKIMWALADGVEAWRFGRKWRPKYPAFDHSTFAELPMDDGTDALDHD